MGTVFLKNATSSTITVAGYTVHYIDSADAEIVEVEGTSGQALPSVGDTVTFGNYPQATSTPEPICNLDCLCNIRERHWEEPWDGEEIQHHDPWYRGFYESAWKKLTQEKEK